MREGKGPGQGARGLESPPPPPPSRPPPARRRPPARLLFVAEGGVGSGSDGFFGVVFIVNALISARNGKMGVELGARPSGNWIFEHPKL